MHSEGRSYMAPLREEAIYPSFEQVAAAVRAHRRRRPWFLVYPIVGALLLLVIGSLGTRMLMTKGGSQSLLTELPASRALLGYSVATQHSVATVPTSIQPVASTASWSDHEVSSTLPALHTKAVQAPGDSLSTQLSLAAPAPVSYSAGEVQPAFENHGPSLTVLGQEDLQSRWQAFASTGLLASRGPIQDRFTNALGVRYALRKHSWLVLEVRRDAFAGSVSSDNTVYHDTTISLNGANYTNTIGTASSSHTSNAGLSFAAGYRYNFDGRVAPSAELLAGGSTYGLILAGSVGLEYHVSDTYALEASTRFQQITAPRSTPIRTVTGNISLSYSW